MIALEEYEKGGSGDILHPRKDIFDYRVVAENEVIVVVAACERIRKPA